MPPKAAKVAKGGDQAENPPDSAGPSLNSTTQGVAEAASPPDPNLSAIDSTRQDPQKQTASQRGKNKKRPRSESLVSNDSRGRGGKRGKGFHRGSHSSSASHYAPQRSDSALRPEGVPGPSGAQIFSQMMSFMTSMADRFVPPSATPGSFGKAENVRGSRPSRGAATPKGKGRGKGRGGKK